MDARWLAVGVGAIAALSGAACRPTDACAEPSAAPCGGDPVGLWNMVDSCQDPQASADLAAIAKRNYRGQPLVSMGAAPPEPTSTDWCADLRYGADGIEFLNLPRNPPKLDGAFITYSDAGNYSALVTTRDITSFHFSASCITRFGYAPTCAEFDLAFFVYAKGAGGITDTSCQAADDGGCTCKYTIESDAAGTKLTGVWAANGGVITHYRADMALPSLMDFCVQGDTMTVWGHDRTSILDVGGVRTMVLQRSVCGNGVVDRDEDCDPPDGATCDETCHAIAMSPAP